MTTHPDVRAFLLHISHYDPVWVRNKPNEQPFDLDTGLAVIDAMADVGMNLLIVDPKDGVEYASHPELKRHYTRPMSVLRELAAHARARGLDVAIKLNFSQSGTHQHNHWFAPHHGLFDNEEYWERGFRIVDELIEAAGVTTYFHIGMDEDHDRTITQYLAAIETLHKGVTQRGLRTVMWNDSACRWPQAAVHREKSLAAEEHAPKDIIHVVWDYGQIIDVETLQRARGRGLAVWGAPGSGASHVAAMSDALATCGGEGLVLTRWTPCVPANREILLTRVRELGLTDKREGAMLPP